MRRARFLLVPLLLSGFWPWVEALEVRPGYLALRQTEAESFDVLWKVPAKGDLRLSLHARLPESCSALAPPSSYFGGQLRVRRSFSSARMPGETPGTTATSTSWWWNHRSGHDGRRWCGYATPCARFGFRWTSS